MVYLVSKSEIRISNLEANPKQKNNSPFDASKEFRQSLMRHCRPPNSSDRWRQRYSLETFPFQLHVQRQAANFVGEHFEARGRASFEGVFALDHRFVDLGAAF